VPTGHGGDDDRICVSEEGTGVGYFCFRAMSSPNERPNGLLLDDSRATRFTGLGNSAGDEEHGSNPGRRVDTGAGLLTPAVGCRSNEDLRWCSPMLPGRSCLESIGKREGVVNEIGS